MKINILANHLRSNNGKILTLEMLEAELREVLSLVPKNPSQLRAKKQHIAALKSGINYKKNHP